LQDRLTVALGLPPFSCTYKAKDKYGEYYASIPIDECVKFDPPQRWRGLWRDEFEGSRFCPSPAKTCGQSDLRPIVWLAGFATRNAHPDGALYAVDFIGRRTSYEGSYGHLGMSDHEVLVDRMISIKVIEQPPKREQ
jgi:hypothetical protein